VVVCLALEALSIPFKLEAAICLAFEALAVRLRVCQCEIVIPKKVPLMCISIRNHVILKYRIVTEIKLNFIATL
jgi:hypothetical protein